MNSEVLQLYLTAQNQLFIKGAILYQLVLVTVGFFLSTFTLQYNLLCTHRPMQAHTNANILIEIISIYGNYQLS